MTVRELKEYLSDKNDNLTIAIWNLGWWDLSEDDLACDEDYLYINF